MHVQYVAASIMNQQNTVSICHNHKYVDQSTLKMAFYTNIFPIDWPYHAIFTEKDCVTSLNSITIGGCCLSRGNKHHKKIERHPYTFLQTLLSLTSKAEPFIALLFFLEKNLILAFSSHWPKYLIKDLSCL